MRDYEQIRRTANNKTVCVRVSDIHLKKMDDIKEFMEVAHVNFEIRNRWRYYRSKDSYANVIKFLIENFQIPPAPSEAS